MATDDEKIFTEEFVKQVRAKLTEEVDKLADKSVLDEREYNKWLTNDAYFIRYVKRKHGDINATIPFLINVLKWRQTMGVSELTEDSFPVEFYDSGERLSCELNGIN